MPSRTVPATPVLQLVGRLPPRQPDANATFVDFVGPLDGLRVLLVGLGQADLMCQLAHHGCAQVASMRPDTCLRPGPADLVIATIRSAEQLAPVIALAGRQPAAASLLLRVPDGAAAITVRQLRQALAAAGFAAGHAHHLRGEAVVVAGQRRVAARQFG